MTRHACYPLLAGSVVLLSLSGDVQQRGGFGKLDRSGAFFHPAFAADPEQVLAVTSAGPIDVATYARYLAAQLGERELEDLAFDIVLERECAAQGVGRSAPTLARSIGAQRYHESGRQAADDADRSVRRKFANEALRQLRADALLRVERLADEDAWRELFDRRYGVGGQRVKVRQVIVSFAATRRRLAAAGGKADDASVRAAAMQRAAELRDRLAKGEPFTAFLRESDDRQTRAMLRDPERRTDAGVLQGYNYVRYGDAFAAVVRGLAVGAVSEPVLTGQGLHLVELVDRKITKREDVVDRLRAELERGTANPQEIQRLRKRLLDKYRFERKD